MLSAGKLIGLMAEPERRRVVAALILSSGDLEDIIDRSGVERRDVVEALDRLSGAGLVEQGSDGTFVLLEELFKAAARAESPSSSDSGTPEEIDEVEEVHEVDEVDVVVARSIIDGRLINLPRKRTKRLLVLDRLAQEFEPGRHYSEREVNQVLRTFEEPALRTSGIDVATLRRYLVDERFLDRADGVYWRSGGTVGT